MNRNHNRGQIILAVGLIGWGVLVLISNLLGINTWALCWPSLLIGAGALMLARPALARGGNDVDVQILGDITRTGIWSPLSSEYWMGIGDVDLDFTQASLSSAETVVRIYQLIGDVELIAPAGLNLTVQTSALVAEMKSERGSEDAFLGTLRYNHNGTGTGTQVRVDILGLINEVKVRVV